MESIGEILKDKRLELGYSIDEMCDKTKLSKIQLQAIEDGNIAFFKDDLSYLSYFVRYYANALGINYNEIRKDLDQTITGFTDTISISKINELERIEANIADKTKPSKSKKGNSMVKVDVASIGMIAIAIAILLGLVFVFVKVIVPSFQKGPDDGLISRPLPPGVENPGEETPEGEDPEGEKPDEEAPEETPEEVPAGDFVVTQVSPTQYDISGWKENDDTLFEMMINVATTLRFTLDGVVQPTPASGVIYNPGEKTIFTTKATQDKVLEVSIGFPLSNQIFINQEEVALDPSVTGSKTATTVTFRFIGE